jgi:hypothetical protein
VVVAANLVELLLCQILCSNSSTAEDSGILGNAVYLANGFRTIEGSQCLHLQDQAVQEE